LTVFNVLAYNKNDYVKNFSFVFTGKHWQLAPTFDLTFSGGMNNQHTTARKFASEQCVTSAVMEAYAAAMEAGPYHAALAT
jgi:serine/threonine protein kinase HipA of HipAB toxin-antitoxin module